MLWLASSATRRPTIEERIKLHVGLDVYKKGICVAAAEPGRAPGRLIVRLRATAARSLLRRRFRDRRMTESRRTGEIACNWPSAWVPAQLSAAGIFDPEDEAIRALSRGREDAVKNRVQARHQLNGSLLRHDIRYAGKTSWSVAYYRLITTLNGTRSLHHRVSIMQSIRQILLSAKKLEAPI